MHFPCVDSQHTSCEVKAINSPGALGSDPEKISRKLIFCIGLQNFM